ncbi:MAG: hypothetical protein EXR69_03920 [Myxococcales bacterium]|nr:hypothetical protein [Myxococcales bacterium]
MTIETALLAAGDRALSIAPGEALFDLDGTLIHGDISESAVEVLAPSGWDWPAYHALVETDDMVQKTRGSIIQAELTAQALAGLTVQEVGGLVDRAFAEGRVRLREETIALAHRLAGHHRVWILTGSAAVLGRAVAPRLGLHNVIGLELAFAGDRLTDKIIPPVTIAAGKITAAWVRLGRRPAFAIGDSPWDMPLLEFARSRVGVGRISGVE